MILKHWEDSLIEDNYSEDLKKIYSVELVENILSRNN